MDPWLEIYWQDVHASLVIYIRDHIQRQLPAPLVARAEEDVSVDVEETSSGSLRPDVHVLEERGDEPGTVVTLAPPVEVAEPLLFRAPEPEIQRRIVIFDPVSGGRIVTVIEILIPTNKMPGQGRRSYLAKQRDLISAGVNLVEVDLIRQGVWSLSITEPPWRDKKRPLYTVCVFRATRPGERAIYPLGLNQSLPRIAIPLRANDRDVALDLQQVIEQAYEDGRYDRTDYGQPLNPPLLPDDAEWATKLLRDAGKM